MAAKNKKTKVPKQDVLAELTDKASRASLARISRFPLKDPIKIEYGDSRWKGAEAPTRCGEGAASFTVAR